MTSKIIFSKIKHTVVKSASDITKTERAEGKLQAGSVTSRLTPGLRIDVLVLKTLPALTTANSFTVDEEDIRQGSRKCFSRLADVFVRKGRLPVHADFFKKIKDGDTIVVILHEVGS